MRLSHPGQSSFWLPRTRALTSGQSHTYECSQAVRPRVSFLEMHSGERGNPLDLSRAVGLPGLVWGLWESLLFFPGEWECHKNRTGGKGSCLQACVLGSSQLAPQHSHPYPLPDNGSPGRQTTRCPLQFPKELSRRRWLWKGATVLLAGSQGITKATCLKAGRQGLRDGGDSQQ